MYIYTYIYIWRANGIYISQKVASYGQFVLVYLLRSVIMVRSQALFIRFYVAWLNPPPPPPPNMIRVKILKNPAKCQGQRKNEKHEITIRFTKIKFMKNCPS